MSNQISYDHEQLEAWRTAVVGFAGWQVEEHHRMRRGRLNPWKSTMCRHPQIMKGRWRTIGHLPNPGYSLRECIELEQQLLVPLVERSHFGSFLMRIVFGRDIDPANWTLSPLDVVALAQAKPAQRLHALVLALGLTEHR